MYCTGTVIGAALLPRIALAAAGPVITGTWITFGLPRPRPPPRTLPLTITVFSGNISVYSIQFPRIPLEDVVGPSKASSASIFLTE